MKISVKGVEIREVPAVKVISPVLDMASFVGLRELASNAVLKMAPAV